MGKVNRKVKKIIIVVVLNLLLVAAIAIGIVEFCKYEYAKDLKQAQTQYNEKQKECVVVGTTNCYIYLSRISENVGKVAGSKWRVTTVSQEEIGTFETNEEGNGGLVGLPYGEYYIEEISTPENVTKITDKYKFIISAYDTSYTLTASN